MSASHEHTTANGFAALLREKKLKATPRRLQLLALLGEAPGPLSIPQILKGFPRRGVDQATVYRILTALRDAGLIREVLTGRTRLFELSDSHHHHVTCTSCGMTEDVTDCTLSETLPTILKQSKRFQSIQNHSLELFGMCRSCAR